jgi:hypothetical protein
MDKQKCTRCGGQFYTRIGLDGEETFCSVCGYEPVTISRAVLAEYKASLGRRTLRSGNPKFNTKNIDGQATAYYDIVKADGRGNT